MNSAASRLAILLAGLAGLVAIGVLMVGAANGEDHQVIEVSP